MAGETEKRAVISNRNGILFLGLIAGIALVVWIWGIWNKPPQMGPDPEVFKTVDALYTAVRNQDMAQLTACESQLIGLKNGGNLPPQPYQHLSAIIQQSKSGEWQPAAKTLYQFMLAQQR